MTVDIGIHWIDKTTLGRVYDAVKKKVDDPELLRQGITHLLCSQAARCYSYINKDNTKIFSSYTTKHVGAVSAQPVFNKAKFVADKDIAVFAVLSVRKGETKDQDAVEVHVLGWIPMKTLRRSKNLSIKDLNPMWEQP